ELDRNRLNAPVRADAALDKHLSRTVRRPASALRRRGLRRGGLLLDKRLLLAKRQVLASGGGGDFARLAVAGSGRCRLLSDPLPADLVGCRRIRYIQPLSRVVKLDFYGECFFFRLRPGGHGQNVLAAPGGVAFVELEIGAGARPLVAVFPDDVNPGRIADGIDAEAFLGLGSNQRAV